MPYRSLSLAFGFVPAMLGFLVYLIAWSILHTWVYNNTQGSVLLMCVMHGSEAWVGYFLFTGAFDQEFGDLGNLGGMVAAMIVATLFVVLVYGAKNLSRKSERIVIQGCELQVSKMTGRRVEEVKVHCLQSDERGVPDDRAASDHDDENWEVATSMKAEESGESQRGGLDHDR